MSETFHIRRRPRHRSAMRSHRLGQAMSRPVQGGAAAAEMPHFDLREPESSRRTLLTGSLAFLIHGGAVGLLALAAALAPVIEEDIIPVQLLRPEAPEPPDEPAPARKALRERRSLDFAPSVQSVQPQIVNPNVVREAAPQVTAEAIQMDAVSASAAPTEISRTNVTSVERVSAINSIASARASAIDVPTSVGPVVRGPKRVNAAAGPSVGPRKVDIDTDAYSIGTGTLAIGTGSSVREGKLSNRDVLGSADGAPLVAVNVAVGDGLLMGSGGTGSSLQPGGSMATSDCLRIPAVQSYMVSVRERMLDRWRLPAGVAADQEVTLRFKLDVAGSASNVELVRADDNALGASAVDALRNASPFPPIPETARCLAQRRLTGTFSNPSG